MKYSELPEELKFRIEGAVTEHEDGSISVEGSVFWGSKDITIIPIKFRRVSGRFSCCENMLISLKNAPDWVGSAFYCFKNRLTSLENAPNFVGHDFYCFENRITSLDGLGEVRGEIVCDNNPVPVEKLLLDYRQKRARKELAGESLAIERILV